MSLLVVSASAQAVIAEWTFPVTQAKTNVKTQSFGPADLGVLKSGTNSKGLHALTSDFQTTTGSDGTGFAMSANVWSQNDYFQFTLGTVGFTHLSVTFDSALTGGTTGPTSFNLYASTDGTTYNVVSGASYTITTSYQTFSFDLSAITGLDNQSAVGFRLLETIKPGKGGSGASPEVSVDNFKVSGGAVPEPATYAAILGGAILVAAVWRQRRARARTDLENEVSQKAAL